MQSLATRNRAIQITILIGVSFLFYQLTNWQHGIWVVISTTAVVTPFSTFLTVQKAQFRFLGTMVGLVITCAIEYYLKFNPSHLPVLTVIITFIVGFMALQSYRYFIIMITLATCLVYSSINAPYTSLTPVMFLIDRGMGVFMGVLIVLLMQRFVFGTANSKLELYEESAETLGKLQKTLQEYVANPTLTSAYKCAADIASNTSALKSYIDTAHQTLGTDKSNELLYAKQVALLNRRAVHLLIDEPTVLMSRIEQLLDVTTAKLARPQTVAV